MSWSVFWGRKFNGKTLPQTVFKDPDWFFWACESGLLRQKGVDIANEAADLFVKARHIRVPQTGPEPLVVEYTVADHAHKLAHVEVVPVSREPHRRSFRKPVVDLCAARELQEYDKNGGALLVLLVKHLHLGGRSTPMTAARCEAFFDDDSNFDMAGCDLALSNSSCSR